MQYEILKIEVTVGGEFEKHVNSAESEGCVTTHGNTITKFLHPFCDKFPFLPTALTEGDTHASRILPQHQGEGGKRNWKENFSPHPHSGCSVGPI
jgi:hypothetical protein